MMEYEDSYDLDEMSDDEKNDLIKRLVADLNSTHTVAAILHNMAVSLSTNLLQYNRWGGRREVIASASEVLLGYAAAVRPILARGPDRADNTRDEFEEIISRLGDE